MVDDDDSDELPMTLTPPIQRDVPDELGRFGRYGGQFVPETLMAALDQLEVAYREAREDESFWQELSNLLTDYVGRPTPLYHAANLSKKLGGAQGGPQIWLKREDLAHTGAHKINNAMGQILLGQAPRQEAHHRRDRRWTARRRNRHRLRHVGSRVHRLHGRRRHPPPSTKRLPHEAPRSIRRTRILR